MRKFFIIVATISIFLVPVFASAINLGVEDVHKAGQTAGFKKATDTTFAETLGTVVNAALSFVGIIFTALTVYAGYLWMTARGETDQIEKAKNILRGAIIGIIITLGAYSISNFVVGRMLDKVSGSGAGFSAGVSVDKK